MLPRSAIVVAGAGTAASAGPGAQWNAGRLVVELLAKTAIFAEVVVAARTQEAADELAALGVTAVVADCLEVADCVRLMGSSSLPVTHVLSTLGGVNASRVGSVQLMNAAADIAGSKLRRFVLMTSLGCGETWEHLAAPAQKFLHDELKAKDLAEAHLRSCGLSMRTTRLPAGYTL
jgi:uncharacterized protein YbjT (DUF2867 family)